ncbi:MAG: hypothetical protein AB7E47_13435 [Desulfovibrionaceae bacterium]
MAGHERQGVHVAGWMLYAFWALFLFFPTSGQSSMIEGYILPEREQTPSSQRQVQPAVRGSGPPSVQILNLGRIESVPPSSVNSAKLKVDVNGMGISSAVFFEAQDLCIRLETNYVYVGDDIMVSMDFADGRLQTIFSGTVTPEYYVPAQGAGGQAYFNLPNR